MRFKGKSVLIVGGSRGIGFGAAQRLASEGAKVLLAGTTLKNCEAAVAKLADAGCQAHYFVADANDPKQLGALLDAAIEKIGGVDVLVYSAGIPSSSAPVWETSNEEFDRVMHANLKGPFMMGKLVAKHMLDTKRTGANIVFVSSVGGILAVPTQVAYSVSKAGLNMLAKVMAVSLAPFGIRVNAVAPGPIMTDMMNDLVASPERYAALMARTPLGRLGSVEEIAGTIAFIASEDGGYFTGQTLYADGGRLPLNYTAEKSSPF